MLSWLTSIRRELSSVSIRWTPKRTTVFRIAGTAAWAGTRPVHASATTVTDAASLAERKRMRGLLVSADLEGRSHSETDEAGIREVGRIRRRQVVERRPVE